MPDELFRPLYGADDLSTRMALLFSELANNNAPGGMYSIVMTYDYQ